MDFLQVEVMTLRGPVRYAVLVVMDLKSRRVEIAGVVQTAYEGWMLPLGEAHLRMLLREFVIHYHGERPHQGIGGDFIEAASDNAGKGEVVRSERLGGLLNYYWREVA